MHQYIPASVTVAAGTTQAAPASQTWRLYPGFVSHFRIRIPPGHGNLTGIRLTYQGTPVIPFDPAAFLVGDNAVHEVPWEDQIMDRGLVIQAFNTDKWPHTFYLWADVDPHLPGGHHPASPAGPAAAPTESALAALGQLGAAAAGGG